MTDTQEATIIDASEDFPFGLTSAQFRKLPKSQQIRAMVVWFHANFEDPAMETPYNGREGGYQYVHGGPYDASEELFDMFGEIVSEKTIAQSVDALQEGGIYDWAPVQKTEDWEDIDGEDDVSLESKIDQFSDELGHGYGDENENQARKELFEKTSELEEALEEIFQAGIGHNQPPESIDDEAKLPEYVLLLHIKEANEGLSTNIAKAPPPISEIKSAAKLLAGAARGFGLWIARKIDLFADEAAKSAGQAVGPLLVRGATLITLYQLANSVLGAAIKWLQFSTGLL
jgi:hypothetical protein